MRKKILKLNLTIETQTAVELEENSNNNQDSLVSDNLKTNLPIKKKRINWKYRRILKEENKSNFFIKNKKSRNSLQYLLLLKKWYKNIDFKQILVLKAFLTSFGKIKARRKTRISVQLQKRIANSIKRARIYKLLPFTVKMVQNIVKKKAKN